MKRRLLGEYFKGACFHFQDQFKVSWNKSAQNIFGKAQSSADWYRAPLNKLQITLYLHVSYIMYQEEHDICRFGMMQLDVGLTPKLPASNLSSAAAGVGERINPRPWP